MTNRSFARRDESNGRAQHGSVPREQLQVCNPSRSSLRSRGDRASNLAHILCAREQQALGPVATSDLSPRRRQWPSQRRSTGFRRKAAAVDQGSADVGNLGLGDRERLLTSRNRPAAHAGSLRLSKISIAGSEDGVRGLVGICRVWTTGCFEGSWSWDRSWGQNKGMQK